MKKLLAIAAVSLLTSVSAHAGFLIDPYLNYVTSGSVDYAPGVSITGNEIGARLGYDFLGFGAGVDALLSGKYTHSQSGTTTDVTPSYMGLFVSYKFPILVRGYFSYLLNLKETVSGGDNFSGNGTKIGVQYTGLPFVAIGLEMFSGAYDTFTSAAGASGPRSDKSSHTNITISVPFSL